jgi:hypothetical protein
MAVGIWYCPTCGYEVRGRGGKCHNCKEPLLESPLPELAEGESEDEVGYNLDEWEDGARGELIEGLIAHGYRHRFEGDELVVTAEDEEDVDQLIAQLGTDGDAGDAADVVPGQVLTKLADAARRLVIDPTDMVADSGLAEAAAGVFAIDAVWGVDEDTWAAVGRVTRRLLGALGAEEALEGEIAESSALLSVLLKGLEGKVLGFGGPVPRPAGKAGDEDEPGEAGEAGDESEVGDAEGADAAAAGGESGDEAAGDQNEMVYELEDWRPEERAQISLMLERGSIKYQWEGSDLVVAEAYDEAVEAILAEVNRTGADDPDESGDETRYLLLSDLFGAADRLAGDPEHEQKQNDLVVLAITIQKWSTPFAVSDDEWWKIRLKASDLAESIEHQASRTVIEDGAANLRDLLRKFV